MFFSTFFITLCSIQVSETSVRKLSMRVYSLYIVDVKKQAEYQTKTKAIVRRSSCFRLEVSQNRCAA